MTRTATPTATPRLPRLPRLVADLEREVRPLLGGILAGLSDLLEGDGTDTVHRFLADAPVDLCVRLADTWALADELGLDPAQLLPHFSPEEQFLIELVTAIYTVGRTAGPREDSYGLGELVGLLSETEDAALLAGV